MKRKCDRFIPMITRALDSELGEPERTELDRHLAACTSCREEFQEFQSLRVLMLGLPTVDSEAVDRAAILTEARARTAQRGGRFERVRAWLTPADLVTAAAVVAGVFLGALLLDGSKEGVSRLGLAASTPVYTVAEYRARSEGRALERQERFRLDPTSEAGSAGLKEISS